MNSLITNGILSADVSECKKLLMSGYRKQLSKKSEAE